MGFVGKELEQTQCGVNNCKSWCHQRCSGFRNLRRAGDNFRWPTCLRGVVVVPHVVRLEKIEKIVVEDSLEIVNCFCYLGDVISCGEGVESAVRKRISCALSKWSWNW